MLGLFGLQPVSYGYDAPTAFVSGAQNIVAASLESQAATVGIAAPLPLSFNREGAASGILANIGQTSNFVAAETTTTRAFWVGTDGEAAAQASGAQVLKPSQAAVDAAKAGNWSPMRAESAGWAKGATGDVPVYFGNGQGRIFLNDELPELLKNMDSGQVKSIDISF
jgi:hypothetical protein